MRANYNNIQYLMKQEPISYTLVSNLTYLAPLGQFFMGAKVFPGTPLMQKSSQKINLFGLI